MSEMHLPPSFLNALMTTPPPPPPPPKKKGILQMSSPYHLLFYGQTHRYDLF